MIPFLDVGATYHELRDELDDAWHRVMDAGWFILGREVEAFEEEFANYCEAQHCVAVSNGLDALHLTLRALDIGPGDEVIVPGHTFIATWLAVTAAGAEPVPVDPHADTWNIDPARVAEAITPRTKAIIPVHLYGQPAEMQPLAALAAQHGLRLIEDAAQAHGARYLGRRVGGLGDAGCFSFYPAKNLGAFGDGGAIVTSSTELADQLRLLRNYGSAVKYSFEVPGHNCRLDELQAAFLRVKLRHLDDWNARRCRLAELYHQELSGVSHLQLPTVADGTEPVWHLYPVCHPDRDRLVEHLSAHQVGTQIHYPCPPHLSPAYARHSDQSWHLPVTEWIARQELSLPIGPQMTEEEVLQVANLVRTFSQAKPLAA